LKDRVAAEEATQDSLVSVLGSLDELDLAGRSFRAHLFGVVFDAIEDRAEFFPLATEGRLSTDGAQECDGDPLEPLTWLTDEEIELLVRRLGWPERQVVLLRYLVRLSPEEVSEALGMTVDDEREAHAHAVNELSLAIAALGERPRFSQRESM